MVERTKVAALFGAAAIVFGVAAVALYRLSEYVGINPWALALLGTTVFSVVWIYDALTEKPS